MKSILDALEIIARKRWVLPAAVVLSIALIYIQARFHLLSADFIVDDYSYYFAARAINLGSNPYDAELLERMGEQEYLKPLERFPYQDNVYPYLYPPLLAGIWRIFTLLPPLTAHRLFLILNALFLGLVFWLMARLVKSDRHPHALCLLFLLLQAINGAAITTLRAGQINIVLMALMLATLYWHLGGKDALSALALTLAILIKVVPAILLLYFLIFYPGRWRYLGWMVLWTVALVGVSMVLAPPVTWLHFFETLRLGPPLGSQFSIWGWLKIHSESSNFLQQNKAWLFVSFAAGLLALALLSIRNTRSQERPLYAFSQLMMLSLLLSPLTWHHHYLFYLLPGYYLIASHWSEQHRIMSLIFALLFLLVVLRLPGDYHMARPIGTLLTVLFAARLIPQKTPLPISLPSY